MTVVFGPVPLNVVVVCVVTEVIVLEVLMKNSGSQQISWVQLPVAHTPGRNFCKTYPVGQSSILHEVVGGGTLHSPPHASISAEVVPAM